MFRIKIYIIIAAAALFIKSYQNADAQTINDPTQLRAYLSEGYNCYIDLMWNDNSNNEQGFKIERSGNGSTWEFIAAVGTDVNDYHDYWINASKRYYYRVYAFSGNIQSGYSNIVHVDTPDTLETPNPPSNLYVTDIQISSITMHWNDNSNNEHGFKIARREDNEMNFVIIDSVGPDVLTYQEVGLTPDHTYYYQICAFNDYGTSEFSNSVMAKTRNASTGIKYDSKIPESYFLSNNYPNPFNPVTNIKFGILIRGFVTLEIFDITGKKIFSLINEVLNPGSYEIPLNGSNLNSGVYFYRLLSGGFIQTKKMMLVK